jgi:tetratricopeptide (TPR) repeat protein
MNRNSIKGIFLSVFVTLFAISGLHAQSYEDAVNAFNEASSLATDGKSREAITAFERVITISSRIGEEGAEIRTRAQNQIPQLYFIIARDLYNSSNLIAAANAFNEAAEQATKYGNQQIAQRSRQAIPQIYFTQGNNHLRAEEFAKAIEMYDKAIGVRPNYAAAYYQKGLVYRQQDNLDEALTYFDRAIQIGESSNERNIVENAISAARNFLLLKGVNSMENRQYRPATEFLRQALQYDDTNADVHYRLAEVYNKQALWDQAITSANRSLELEQGGRTDRAKIYFELGTALKNSGRFAPACEAFSNSAFGQFRAASEHEMEHELKCGQPNRR